MSNKKSIYLDSYLDSGLEDEPALYVVATPIGNLGDITQRALQVLEQVDCIAAEDTRHSQKLLSHFGIQTRLLACHEHNETQVAEKFIQRLEKGESVALISDAGTPLVSDPGYRLIDTAHQHGCRVVPIPGACAAIAALCVAGLATDRFAFEGFPPARSAARQQFFQDRVHESRTMVFYLSCHKLADSVSDMVDVFGGQRMATLARELTKTFETIQRLPLAELLGFIHNDDNQRKGEMVLVLEGARECRQGDDEIETYLGILMQELPLKQAVKLVVKLTGSNKNDVYKRAVALRNEGL